MNVRNIKTDQVIHERIKMWYLHSAYTGSCTVMLVVVKRRERENEDRAVKVTFSHPSYHTGCLSSTRIVPVSAVRLGAAPVSLFVGSTKVFTGNLYEGIIKGVGKPSVASQGLK